MRDWRSRNDKNSKNGSVSSQKNNLIILIVLSIIYFLAFIPPNISASENIEMVRVFEPDEAVPLPYVFNMIRPAETLKDTIKNFIFYKYYFYGYPYFAVSALVLLPLKALNELGNTALGMLLLRQIVSILPMILSIWILVFLQTRLRGYRAIVLMVFLFTLPAVIKNNFWWHPDGLAILFAMLTIFFLERDQMNFGKDFYLAAVMCGYSAGIKGIGFFFFLVVLVYLISGFVSKKINAQRLILSAFGFLALMAFAYLFANPDLLFASVRKDYFKVMFDQSQLMAQGFTVVREKGLQTILPKIIRDFGNWPILAVVFTLCIWGAVKGPRRSLNRIILTWAIPMSILVFFLIHYQFQYWLPVALPLFSTLALILPVEDEFKMSIRQPSPKKLGRLLLLGLFIFTLGSNLLNSAEMVIARLKRAENSPAFNFHEKAMEALRPLPGEREANILADVRMYTPPYLNWYFENSFGDIDYDFIQERGFDVLLISRQRMLDQLNQGVMGIDEQSFSRIKAFYRDAREGKVDSYRLLYQDDFGIVFIQERLYERYY